MGYRGDFPAWLKKYLGWTIEIVKRPSRWVVSPKMLNRCHCRALPFLNDALVVERTIAWIGRNRRMSKDYEFLPETSESFIYAAMSRLMLIRLAKSVKKSVL